MATRTFGWSLPPRVIDLADPADELEEGERLAALLLRPQDQRCDRCDVHYPHRRCGDELLCEACFEAAEDE